MNPVFTFGKTTETKLSAALAGNSNSLSVNNASDYFSVGDKIFISNPDYTNKEYLGSVISVSSSQIQTLFSSVNAKDKNSAVWKPDKNISVLTDEIITDRILSDTGIVFLKSMGGNVYLNKVAEPLFTEKIIYKKLGTADEYSLMNWFVETLSWGLSFFTYVDKNRVIYKAAMNPDKITCLENGKTQKDVSIELILTAKEVCDWEN